MIFTVLGSLLVLLGGILYVPVTRFLHVAGIYPQKQFTGVPTASLNSKCRTVGNKLPFKLACEKAVLHSPTSTVYMACDDFDSRQIYWPGLGRKKKDLSFAGSGGIYMLDLRVNALFPNSAYNSKNRQRKLRNWKLIRSLI
jgi:hypothetical protein